MSYYKVNFLAWSQIPHDLFSCYKIRMHFYEEKNVTLIFACHTIS